jgi:hypothetical protein
MVKVKGSLGSFADVSGLFQTIKANCHHVGGMVDLFAKENGDGAILAALIANILCPAIVAGYRHNICFSCLFGESRELGKDGSRIATLSSGQPFATPLVRIAKAFGGGGNEGLFGNHTHMENPN